MFMRHMYGKVVAVALSIQQLVMLASIGNFPATINDILYFSREIMVSITKNNWNISHVQARIHRHILRTSADRSAVENTISQIGKIAVNQPTNKQIAYSGSTYRGIYAGIFILPK